MKPKSKRIKNKYLRRALLLLITPWLACMFISVDIDADEFKDVMKRGWKE